jgi:hypothetical protein
MNIAADHEGRFFFSSGAGVCFGMASSVGLKDDHIRVGSVPDVVACFESRWHECC